MTVAPALIDMRAAVRTLSWNVIGPAPAPGGGDGLISSVEGGTGVLRRDLGPSDHRDGGVAIPVS